MLKKLIGITLVAVFLSPINASAQEAMPEAGEATGGTNADSGVVYKKETVYDFEADDVEGALVRPLGEDIGGRQHGKTSSLIEIRSDFVPELLKSVEDL